MPQSGFATVGQVADWLQVHEKTVQDLVARGALPAPIRLGHRTIRFNAAEVRRMLEHAQP